MTMKTTMRKAMATALVVLTGFLPMATKAGPLAGDAGYVQRETTKDSYAEANVFYGFPGKVNGYTFLDLYSKDGGFCGKTTLTKEIADSGLSARVQAVHGNQVLTDAGLGLEAKLPTPKNVTAKVNCTPVWMNGDGKENHTVKVGYFVALALPKNFSLSSFGEANVANSKGATWAYGEVELAKKIGNLSVGYNAALVNSVDGKATPEINHGIAIRYSF